MVRGKYYFILSIFKSGDDRKGERERNTAAVVSGWAVVCVCVRSTSSYNLVIKLMIDRENKKLGNEGQKMGVIICFAFQEAVK